MRVTVRIPAEFQGSVVTGISKRKGIIVDSDAQEEGTNIIADVPLNQMFGFSSELRSMTQGKGEFSMEYKNHMPILPSSQEDIVSEYEKNRCKRRE